MNPEAFLISGSWPLTITVWVFSLAALTVLLVFRTQIRNFSGEVRVELAKASWPWEPKEKGVKKYKELIDSTLIVVIAMFLLAGYVSGWDFIMNLIVGYLFQAPTPLQ
jgi:preprotein translocase subunit SecE